MSNWFDPNNWFGGAGDIGHDAPAPSLPPEPSACQAALPAAPVSRASVDALGAAMDFIWAPERDGHQDDSAPGEKFHTSWGVTDATWDDAVRRGIVTGLLVNATKVQCRLIYKADYWDALRCGDMAPGVGFVLFNDATLMGCGRVGRLLQRCVGAVDDGQVGPKTVALANAMKPADLITKLIAADEIYLAALANAPKFINGWTRREEAAKAAALALT